MQCFISTKPSGSSAQTQYTRTALGCSLCFIATTPLTSEAVAGILGEAGSLLGQAARAPLPGVPNVTTGVFLNSLFREVANVTGLLNATESVAQQAQAAGVPGNLTQVRVMHA